LRSIWLRRPAKPARLRRANIVSPGWRPSMAAHGSLTLIRFGPSWACAHTMRAVPWLIRDGEVLATLEVAASPAARLRGLLGRDGFGGAILIRHARSVHTIGMRFPIDVAFCDRDLRVVDICCAMAR